jgi:hypothetical protein
VYRAALESETQQFDDPVVWKCWFRRGLELRLPPKAKPCDDSEVRGQKNGVGKSLVESDVRVKVPRSCFASLGNDKSYVLWIQMISDRN